jgi:hypothetical protein
MFLFGILLNYILDNENYYCILIDLIYFISMDHLHDIGQVNNSGLLGFWTLAIVGYSKNTKEHNVSETGSVSIFR